MVMLGAALAACAATWLLNRIAPRLLMYRSSTAVAVIVIASAALAALAPGDPTGLRVADALYRAAFGALVAIFAARAPRVAWLVAAGLAAVGAHPHAWGIAGFALLGLAAGATFGGRWGRPAAALWGTALAQVLLRMTWPEPVGLTALMAAVAVVVLGVSWRREAHPRHRRLARRAGAGMATATVVLVALAALAGLAARSGLTHGVHSAEDGLAAARAGELADAADRFEQASTALAGAHRDLSAWWVRPARMLPVVGRYLADAETLTEAGTDVARQAGRVARRSSSQMHVVDGGIDLVALRKLRAELADSIVALGQAEISMRGPSAAGWTPGPLRNRYERLATRLRDGMEDAEVLLRAVDLAPDLLGDKRPRRWLLTVFSPVEQRTSGGVLGNYGELVSEEGHISLERFGRIIEVYGLQPERQATLEPELAEAFARYGDLGITTYFQNAMQTPDFSLAAAAMEHLYPQLDGAKVTGTIAVDPTGLAALLEVTGPVTVASWPEPITAANAERILYFEQYLEYQGDERGDFLGEVAEAVIERLTTGDLGAPSVLIRALAPAIDAGHLLFHTAIAEEQAFIESVGAGGAVAAPDGGDFLRIGTQNATQAKLEWFLHRSVRYLPTFDPETGGVTSHLEVELRNDAPGEGLPAYIIGGSAQESGLPPAGHNRLWFTIYSPLDLVGATIDGVPLTLTREREVGYNAYAAFIEVPPESTITVAVDLHGTVSRNRVYRLRVGSQPQVHPDRLEVTVAPAPGWEAGETTAHEAVIQAAELTLAVPLHRP